MSQVRFWFSNANACKYLNITVSCPQDIFTTRKGYAIHSTMVGGRILFRFLATLGVKLPSLYSSQGRIEVTKIRGGGMAQWLSNRLPRRPPTNVARVRFPDRTRRQMWVVFSKFQFDLEFEGHRFVITLKYFIYLVTHKTLYNVNKSC